MAVMEQAEIQALLPHRYPFLLVDRVLELEPDRRIVAIKNVTVNEPFLYLTGVDSAKFRKPVVPGDRLRIEVEVLRKRPPFWKMQANVYVDDDMVCEAEVTAMVTEEKTAKSEG